MDYFKPQYTLKNNFVTNNGYMCIELNAHALISFVMTIRDNFNDDNFLPWWLGSQSCEKAFQAARSMTITFSTVINFGMLGLLRRLHRLQIQANLQAESIETGIVFPRARRHLSKDDGQSSYQKHSLEKITDESIYEAVKRAQISAMASIEKLGMLKLLQKNKIFDSISIPNEGDILEDLKEEEEEEVDESERDAKIESQIQEVCVVDASEITEDINLLSKSGYIDVEVKEKLSRQKSVPLKTLLSTSISMFSPEGDKKKPTKLSPLLQIDLDGKTIIYIRKTIIRSLIQS